MWTRAIRRTPSRCGRNPFRTAARSTSITIPPKPLADDRRALPRAERGVMRQPAGATSSARVAFPPGPPDEFGLKRLFRMSRDPLGFFSGLRREYGRLVHYRVGPRHVWFVGEPDLVEEGLVKRARSFLKDQGLELTKPLLGEGLLTSEGELHRRQRRLAQPAFHRRRIASYGSVMVEYADRLSNRWQNGDTFDISREMTRLTLRIVAKTLFDADVESDVDQVG